MFTKGLKCFCRFPDLPERPRRRLQLPGERGRRGGCLRRDEHDAEAAPETLREGRRREGLQALLRGVDLLRQVHHREQHPRGQSHESGLCWIHFSRFVKGP